MMIWIRRVAIAALLVYMGIASFTYFGQRKALYFPPDYYHQPPSNMTEIRTDDGNLGWYSPAENGQPTVMIFHGNASSIDSNLHIFRDLQAMGCGVWSVGYPGYPGTEGTPNQRVLVASAADQYKHLSAMGVETIVFYGTSLGSGVASQLAASHAPALLVLDAPFNSVSDMARKQLPFLPTGILLKDTWRSDLAIKNLRVPLIWIHGTEDNVMPISQGQILYDGYEGPTYAHIISAANHTNTWARGGRNIVLTALNNL